MQLVCGLLVAFSGLQLDKITLSSGFTIHLEYFSCFDYALVATFMNAINMLDGMDGFVSNSSYSEYIFGNNRLFTGDGSCCFFESGSCRGILGFFLNFPARFSWGRSLFLGFIYSIMPLIGIKSLYLTVFFIPLILLLVPLMDMLHVVKDRLKGGYHIFVADRSIFTID